MDEEQRLKIDVLLEEYRCVSQEIQLYLQEIIRCFIYASIIVAVHLGWGLHGGENSNPIATKISNYVPYGYVILGVYFLSINYLRISLKTYRGILESRINEVVGSKLMSLESEYLDDVQSKGFLRVGKLRYLPTPLLLLGVLVFVSSVIVFYLSNITNNRNIVLVLIVVCGFIALYIFFVFPELVKRGLRKKRKT